MTYTSSEASFFMFMVNLDLISQSDSDFELECANTAAIAAGVDSNQYIKLGIKCLGVEVIIRSKGNAIGYYSKKHL